MIILFACRYDVFGLGSWFKIVDIAERDIGNLCRRSRVRNCPKRMHIHMERCDMVASSTSMLQLVNSDFARSKGNCVMAHKELQKIGTALAPISHRSDESPWKDAGANDNA